MEFSVIFTSVLGFTLILARVVVDARYIGKWRAEDRRLERRLRDWQ